MPGWLVLVILAPLVVGGIACMIGTLGSNEVTGYLKRRSKEDIKRAIAVLPEPEATIRAEEWYRHLIDYEGEPLRAYLYARSARRAALAIAAELQPAVAPLTAGARSPGHSAPARKPASGRRLIRRQIVRGPRPIDHWREMAPDPLD